METRSAASPGRSAWRQTKDPEARTACRTARGPRRTATTDKPPVEARSIKDAQMLNKYHAEATPAAGAASIKADSSTAACRQVEQVIGQAEPAISRRSRSPLPPRRCLGVRPASPQRRAPSDDGLVYVPIQPSPRCADGSPTSHLSIVRSGLPWTELNTGAAQPCGLGLSLGSIS